MRILLLSSLLVFGVVSAQENTQVSDEHYASAEGEGVARSEAEQTNQGVGKTITLADTGDFTLLSIPWSKATPTLGYNETSASTISTLGNLGLLIGGLYLLSGFQGAATNLARSDPLGVSRRFKHPPPPPRRPQWINHKTGQLAPARAPKQKKKSGHHHAQMKKMKTPVYKKQMPVSSKYARTAAPATNAEERQLIRPRFPTLPQFRMPTLRPIRIPRPSLPSLPSLRNPFNRPSSNSRPAFRPAAAGGARPAPRPNNARPSPPQQTPLPPVSNSVAPPPETSSFRNQESTLLPETPVAAVSRPAEIPASFSGSDPTSTFNANFGGDPFDEFRNSDFGDAADFRNLLDEQFGDFQFDKVVKRS